MTVFAARSAARAGATPARRRRSSVLLVVVLLGLIAAGYAALAPRSGADSSGGTPENVARGRQLYLEGCSSCHGLNAQGGNRAPSLIGVGGAAVDFQVSSGRMPLAQHEAQAQRKQPAYNQTEIDQMAAYIQSLGGGPQQPQSVESAYKDGDIALGGELFRTNCASCHNFNGSGGALTQGHYAPTLYPATPKQIYEAMLTGPENMPVFGDKQLTPKDKLSIIKYIKGIHAEADPGGNGLGRLGPIPEGLVAVLVGIGGLVIVTLWIGARQ